MKLPKPRHSWNLSPTEAIALQRELAAEVRQIPLPRPPRLVAGGDAAFSPDGTQAVAGWIVWNVHDHAIVESAVARCPVGFPYIPGLLSFREAPALLAAAAELQTEPEAFMLDGQGLAHPRRFGIACHFGLLIDRPTLGCAKSRLCGIHDTPADTIGASKPLLLDDTLVGRVVRTRVGVNPVYISAGHDITLDDAVRLVLRCCSKYRLPEPTRLAHRLVTRARGGPPIEDDNE